MESNAIIGRLFSYQSLLDRAQNVCGLVLQQPLSAGGQEGSQEVPADAARQIINALLYAGMSEPSTRYRYWLEVDAGFLRSTLPDYLPGEKIVLILRHPEPTDATLAARCAELKTRRNYKLALKPQGDGSALPGFWKSLADVICLQADQLTPALIQAWHQSGAKLLAYQIPDDHSFTVLASQGVDYLLGDTPLKAAKEDAEGVLEEKSSILNLIQQLSNYESSSDRTIETELKRHPEVLMHLLELAGSAHLGLKTGLGSIRQIMQIIGRQRIINWLYVLWLCAKEGDTLHALTFRALWRSRFMEQLVHYTQHRPGSHMEDQAFMTGLLSLAPGILGISEEALFERMNIDVNIRQGVTSKTGMLGQLLCLTYALEKGDFDGAERLCHSLHLDTHTVLHCQQEAIAWVNKTHSMIAD